MGGQWAELERIGWRWQSISKRCASISTIWHRRITSTIGMPAQLYDVHAGEPPISSVEAQPEFVQYGYNKGIITGLTYDPDPILRTVSNPAG